MSLATPRFVFSSCRRRHTEHRESFPRAGCGNLPVRFDEREQETELCQTGLRRVMRKHPNSQREATATAPVLDSTPHFGR
jgi:hypothetical protein